MKKALEKALARKYRNELIEANKQLHEHIWFLMEKSHKPDTNTVSTSNSDLTLITIATTTTNGNIVSQPTNDIEMRRIRKIERQVTDDQTKLLIDENINLRIQ